MNSPIFANKLTLSEVLAKLRQAENLVFDVDGTLVERQQTLSPEFASTLAETGKNLLIATSRASNELDEIFLFSGSTRERLFKGHIVLEDGGVVINPQGQKELSVDKEIVKAIIKFREFILKNMTPDSQFPNWYRLGNIDSPLVFLPTQYDYQTSFSLWQKIDGLSLEEKNQALAAVMHWCQKAVSHLEIEGAFNLSEIGDGTLRASAHGISKGEALKRLFSSKVLDPKKTVYFGDGQNDVHAAKILRESGGDVVVANTYCSDLVKTGSFVLQTGPNGIRELLNSL